MSLDATGMEGPLSVSALTDSLRRTLESEYRDVRVRGEVSNWTVAASGHAYFSLKDEGAQLSCVMWRSALRRVRAQLRDGLEVDARGSLSIYPQRGQYQLMVETLVPAGEGALWQKFLEAKARLEAQGLFDDATKRRIPPLPSRIGIVTSPTGAAIRDMISVLRRRARGVEVLLYPARVQGTGAAAEIAAGIRALGLHGNLDVLIVGRGGGSLEDLWAFNDEDLAHAIASCPVPVISAVGHETDFTIADFVADLRAPTPSAAAELVSADRAETAARVREGLQRLERIVDARLADSRRRALAAINAYAFSAPESLLRDAQQRADDAIRALDGAVDGRLADAKSRARSASAALMGHDPALILKKGYAIVRTAKDGRVATSVQRLKPGRRIATEFADGTAHSIVTDDQPDLFDGA